MDLTGAMPKDAWYEIRDASGRLLASIPARIDGGSISAELPGFPPNTMGTIQLFTSNGPEVLDPPELEELPTKAMLVLVQY